MELSKPYILWTTVKHFYPVEIFYMDFYKFNKNRNIINFRLVLASLGKFNKVECASFTQKTNKQENPQNKTDTHTHTHTHTHKTLYRSHLKQSADCNPRSRVQWCLSRAGEGAGTALCALSWHAHIRKSSTHKRLWINTVKKPKL